MTPHGVGWATRFPHRPRPVPHHGGWFPKSSAHIGDNVRQPKFRLPIIFEYHDSNFALLTQKRPEHKTMGDYVVHRSCIFLLFLLSIFNFIGLFLIRFLISMLAVHIFYV